jgi:hypothetical protein
MNVSRVDHPTTYARQILVNLRACAMIVPALAIGAAVMGCASPGSSGGAATGPGRSAAVRFADCMRAHGVSDFPDPLPSGGFPRGSARSQSPASRVAQKTCVHLLRASNGSRQAPTSTELAAALRYARCMRAHGVPSFPDPVTSLPAGSDDVIVQGPILFPLGSAINTQAPTFERADGSCGGQPPAGHPQGG